MTYYLRSTRTTDATPYESEDSAIKWAHILISRQKSFGRLVTQEGRQIVFREKNGELFEAIWLEDEDGNSVHIPMV